MHIKEKIELLIHDRGVSKKILKELEKIEKFVAMLKFLCLFAIMVVFMAKNTHK